MTDRSIPGPLGSPSRHPAQEADGRCAACGHRKRDHSSGACGAPPRAAAMRDGALVCGCTAIGPGPLGSPKR